jgi:hypothetical protein
MCYADQCDKEIIREGIIEGSFIAAAAVAAAGCLFVCLFSPCLVNAELHQRFS